MVTSDNSSRFVIKRAIPDVRGLSLNNARKMLENEGFKNIKVLEEETDSYPPGAVISQTPAASSTEYELSRDITIVVAKSTSAAEPDDNEVD